MFTRAFCHARTSRRLRRLAPVGVSLALIAAPLALQPVVAGAAATTTLSGSPFNGSDGVLDTNGSIGAHNDVGTPDTFAGGVKEDTDCPPIDGGGAPDKSDILTGWVGNANGVVSGANHTFLYLGWSRPANEGTATIDFELDSGTESCGVGSPFVKRVAGTDLLITYDFQGGNTVGVSVRTWASNNQGGAWSNPTTLPVTKAEASISGNQLFGEAVIDMTAAGFFQPGVCKGFSSAMLKSRSSSSSFENQVKDLILPFPVEVTNCGSLTVTKTVVGGAGESFSFTVDCGSVDLNGTAEGTDLTFSLANSGSRKADDIPLGSVCSVSETDPGSSRWTTTYKVDSASSQGGLTASNIAIALGNKTVAFTNTRKVGNLIVSKVTTGGTGTFTFHVDCTGTAYDQDVTVSNSGSQTITGIPTETSCTVSEVSDPLFTSTRAPLNGTVTIDANGETVAFTNTAKPNGISIDKKVNGEDTSAGNPLDVEVGSTLTYTVEVTNSGQMPLSIYELTDTLKSDIGATCVPSVETSLDPGDSITCTYTMTASDPGGASIIHNTATVIGIDVFNRSAGPEDDQTWVHVLNPQVHLDKTGPASAHVGDTITYTLTVTNPGNTPLDITDWDDDVCDGEPVLKTKEGDDNRLDPGETWVYNCSHVVVAGDPDRLVNTATVTGIDDLEHSVDSTDDAVSTILRPAISITKTGPTNAHVGDPVVYTLVVTNAGNTPLSSVTVTDPKCDGLPVRSNSDADGLLSPGESWTYHCTHVVVAGDGASILNTAEADGTDPLGQTVTSADNHTAVVLHPAISIVKTANPESVSVSGPVTYTYVVTNTGDTMLKNVTVTDDILGAIGSIGELAASESATLSKTVQVDASTPPRNIGTAVGTDILGQTVSATDDAVITVVLARSSLPSCPGRVDRSRPKRGRRSC